VAARSRRLMHLDVAGRERAARRIAACGLDAEGVLAAARLAVVHDVDDVRRRRAVLGRVAVDRRLVAALHEYGRIDALDLSSRVVVDDRALALRDDTRALRVAAERHGVADDGDLAAP